jgi:Chromate transporter
VAGLAAVGPAALAGYLAGVNALVILTAAGLAVTLVANRRRLRPAAHCRLPVLPVPPVGLLAAAVPARRHPGLVAIAGEFCKFGVVVFGSGYVLLAFLRRDLVADLGWLSTRQVLDAVVAGQITPGPVFTTSCLFPGSQEHIGDDSGTALASPSPGDPESYAHLDWESPSESHDQALADTDVRPLCVHRLRHQPA